MPRPTPIFRLRREARLLSRERGIPLHAALDRIAQQNGFRTWSLLVTDRNRSPTLASALLDRLRAGDLLLLGARPRQGKTRLGIDLVAEAVQAGRRGHVFSSECTAAEVQQRIGGRREPAKSPDDAVQIETPRTLDADQIIESVTRHSDPAPEDVILIDYLQTLDQRRDAPPIDTQVRDLKDFARETGVIIATLSQIDPSFDPGQRPLPDLRDVRRPNPFDLGHFTRTCFLHGGRIALPTA